MRNALKRGLAAITLAGFGAASSLQDHAAGVQRGESFLLLGDAAAQRLRHGSSKVLREPATLPAMTELSERELREAAEEAGISPAELRQQLAKTRGHDLPASIQRQQGIVAAPTRGVSARHTENNLALPPDNAVRAVRSAIERQMVSLFRYLP